MEEATLRKFCAVNDIRYYLLNPIRRDGFLYATNGHIAVVIPDNTDIKADSETPKPDFGFIHKAMAKPKDFSSLVAELPEPNNCPACKGSGLTVTCKKCDGEGVVVRSHREYDCRDCRGDGYFPATIAHPEGTPCWHCDGDGHDPYQTVVVGHTTLSRRYVVMLMTLPEVAIWTNPEEPYTCAFFKFDGGFGAVMPCLRR